MDYARSRGIAWLSATMLLACTEALHVGNEPAQASGTGGKSATTGLSEGGTSGVAAMTATPGGATSTAATCRADPQLTPQQAEGIMSAACNAWSIEFELVPTKLGLVVDVSSSMAEPLTGETSNRWDVTRSALSEILLGTTDQAGLPPSASVGLLLYPNQLNDTSVATSPTDVTTCLNVSAMTPAVVLGNNDASSQRSLLRQRLSEAILGRGTPTHDAYDYALYNMMLTPQSADALEERYLLLITDGHPSYYKGCYNPSGELQALAGDPVLASIQYAYSTGIKTFVIGIPGSDDAKAWLSKAAYLGGTAASDCAPEDSTGPYCHSDLTLAVDFDLALRAALKDMLFPSGNCQFGIPQVLTDGTRPLDPNRMSPLIHLNDGTIQLLNNNTNAAAVCSSGWRFVGPTTMEINKDACRRFLAGDSTLQVVFGCTPGEITATLP